ncbi:MAG: OmpA family protein [Dysgonamonadaceae bacterium]|jgi:chemotaxis protein MotB|nr:OmpA family protein [Dysgonamonadaceae bacterium]
MKYVKISFILLVAALGLSSCVSSTQYNSLNSDYRLLMDDRNRINERMNNLASENAALKRRVQELEEIAKKYETTEAERVSLQKQLVELQGLMDRSRRQNIKETGSMSIEIQRTREELQKREDDLAAKLRELQQMQDEMEKRNKRLTELEAILARKDSTVNALRRKVSDALLGFEGKGLIVHTKNGKVYVSMEDKLLFKSGSYNIEARGAGAIKDLAQMLAQNPEINVLIEGHTDDVTYRGTGDLKDNWDLSVKRATSVIRELLKNSHIDPQRITAAGRGEFIPLDNAKTADARQKNRRIEIILTPKLDELFEILE